MEPLGEEKKLIVLIEDEAIITNLLQSKLEKAGYLVESAKNGVAGLGLIHELEPDLVLLDMLLPRLNGFGVLEKLYEAKLLPKLPVIIISNSGQPIEIERALKLGIRDYLIKVNFDPNDVLQKVNGVFALQAGEIQKGEKGETESASGQARGTILIVEDDAFLVELLERKFRQEKYMVHKAMDADQARRLLESIAVDVILLDIVLPGQDGFAFLSELKKSEKLRHIPVLIISNLGQKEEIQKGLEAGAADYIVKAHVSPSEIVRKVEALLNKINQRLTTNTD